ncbi:MAG: glycosyltransferase [Acidobacteria bacterium]|nr:MAG: glycosyltransferase [Acidobacteriota bacterium]
MKISVIIPVLNERECVPGNLNALRQTDWIHEIIVVDGGSTDGTLGWLQQRDGVRIVEATVGRGIQLNAGARVATGDTLVFLHADTRLPPDAGKHLKATLGSPEVAGGCFCVRFQEHRPRLLGLVAAGINWRTRVTHSATGDQAIFVRRGVFEKLGGFREWPLFEDVDFVSRMKRVGRLATIRSRVTISARRHLNYGIWRTVLLIYFLRIGFWTGISSFTLARWYERSSTHMPPPSAFRILMRGMFLRPQAPQRSGPGWPVIRGSPARQDREVRSQVKQEIAGFGDQEMRSKSWDLSALLRAGGAVLLGRRPVLSIEITRECPLRCPGCYAFDSGHLGVAGPLRQLSDLQGDALVSGVLELVNRFRPVYVSIVGGEPLVRFRELSILLPRLSSLGLEVQLVTSAVRPIPTAWRDLQNLHLVISVDGLQPEHDRRRAPATYDRILKHIAGHRLIVHCTITRQLLKRPGYLEEFTNFWSNRAEIKKIWFSLYTPQQGDRSAERLAPLDRIEAVAELSRLRARFKKIDLPQRAIESYLRPPASPGECIFAQTTLCVSADLATRITPCQFGGNPVCTECGCMASAGLIAIGRHRVAGLLPVSAIYSFSRSLGGQLARMGTMLPKQPGLRGPERASTIFKLG